MVGVGSMIAVDLAHYGIGPGIHPIIFSVMNFAAELFVGAGHGANIDYTVLCLAGLVGKCFVKACRTVGVGLIQGLLCVCNSAG